MLTCRSHAVIWCNASEHNPKHLHSNVRLLHVVNGKVLLHTKPSLLGETELLNYRKQGLNISLWWLFLYM